MDVICLHRAWLVLLTSLLEPPPFGANGPATLHTYQQSLWALQNPCDG